ncbi:MAG TPA: T9SS type A sorting domain-containing protein [Chitinophagales bacterium]|nr:T9SS type A sorting domain-containing protein [Chitinophagales bacterium]
MKRVFTFCLVAFISLVSVSSVLAQAGQLDPSFGVAGELADADIYPWYYSDMAMGQGGQFVITTAHADTIAVIRFLSDGTRDVSFGNSSNGRVVMVRPAFSGAVYSSVVQSDRKTIIAGTDKNGGSVYNSFLLRLKDDGSIDSTFGTNGFVYPAIFPGASGEAVSEVRLQLDGKIVAMVRTTGATSNDSVAIIRLNSTNGGFDNSFATNGVYFVHDQSIPSDGTAYFAIDLSNNINFATYSGANGVDNIYAFQLDQTGSFNPSFGLNGSVLISNGYFIDGPYNLGFAFQPDGKLVTVQSALRGDTSLMLARYNTDGTADASFGGDGHVVPALLDVQPFSIHNLNIDNYGNIVASGTANVAGGIRTIVACLNPNGSMNVSFGDYSGYALLNNFEWDNLVYNVAILPDNNILINGLVNENNYKLYQVVRLTGAAGVFSGINTQVDAAAIAVYPNPVSSYTTVYLPVNAGGNIVISDLSGRLIAEVKATGGTTHINTANLPAGVYMVNYRDTRLNTTLKIVKQ